MPRRTFLGLAAQFGILAAPVPKVTPAQVYTRDRASDITLFLSGDVMTGRGIDQILEHPVDSRLHEPGVKDAVHYVEIAEAVNGPIPRQAHPSYIWGDALARIEEQAPDCRIINLETAVTQSNTYWQGKDIHYRMHPKNVACLTAARIDCCTLANNHLLDWGHAGLLETLDVLASTGIETAGGGRSQAESEEPAILAAAEKGRVVVVSVGSVTSGIPFEWAARNGRPGLNVLRRWSRDAVRRIAARTQQLRQPRDLVVVSIHWGGNWGYGVPQVHREFAHRLIDDADVHLVHGHSSHHPLGIEVYRERPILYGCGDFLNDYEGIRGYAEYRSDLVLAYFVRMDATSGHLRRLTMAPFQIRQFRLGRAPRDDAEWISNTLSREGRPLGTAVQPESDGLLTLRW